MYSIKLSGINTKDNDRNVSDGSLQEAINVQWRENSMKPIPERLITDINAGSYAKVIFHKIGDEGQINVLGFKSNFSAIFLAFDIAEYLAAGDDFDGLLTWFGTITDGVYASRPELTYNIPLTPGMSWTNLNGILYFMGDGSNSIERYYKRLQYNDTSGYYELKDMYAWKSLIPKVPLLGLFGDLVISFDDGDYPYETTCGVILYRYTIVLKTGEEVLHTPMYVAAIMSVNFSEEPILTSSTAQNIHTIIPLNLEFEDMELFRQEVSAINVYASTPYYTDKLKQRNRVGSETISEEDLITNISILAEQPFYRIKTIEAPVDEVLVLFQGGAQTGFEVKDKKYSVINLESVAAGSVMPADDFSYHKLFGEIISLNGRVTIKSPTTVLSSGCGRALSTSTQYKSSQGYIIDTEDGQILGKQEDLNSGIYIIDHPSIPSTKVIESRGILSYPDIRGSLIAISPAVIGTPSGSLVSKKLRKNSSHNMSSAFDVVGLDGYFIVRTGIGTRGQEYQVSYDMIPKYNSNTAIPKNPSGTSDHYLSENRFQVSAVGEFSVFPSINSYRVNEKIVLIADNTVDPKNADLTAPIVVGTTGGLYTVNLDPRGQYFISNITQAWYTPFLSPNYIQLDDSILFVSDRGLMATQGGAEPVCLTEDFFPAKGSGGYPVNESVFPGYNSLMSSFFGGGNNPYILDDVVSFMKNAIFAYDARRRNVWCSNPSYNFSLVFNIDTKTWVMSTLTFSDAIDYYSYLKIGGEDVYSRYMLRGSGNYLIALSGEDLTKEVSFHILTRPIKFNYPKDYKVITRAIARCIIKRSTLSGYFSLGMWGRQDVNKDKKAIPIVTKKDSRSEVFSGNVRNDIPIDARKGKYKAVSVLLSGKALPNTDIDSIDFDVALVDNSKIR